MEYLDSRKFLSVLYHDIFDYPLTPQELLKWQARLPDGQTGSGGTKNFPVEKTGRFYHLPGRAEIVVKRLARKTPSLAKYKLAALFAQKIAQIPTVLLVGITGALAMENTSEEDDIDLLIVTRKGALWTTRLVATLLIEILRIPRRKPGDSNVKDRLCLNLWLDEGNLALSPQQRNIYTAHEVLQIVPLVNKESTHERFILANRWAQKFWPNANKAQIKAWRLAPKPENFIALLLNILVAFVEPLAWKFQFWYMRKKRTREVIEAGRAFFHPVDWQKPVLSTLRSKVLTHFGFANFFFA